MLSTALSFVNFSNSSSILLHSDGSRLAKSDFIEALSSTRDATDSGKRRVPSDLSTLPSLKACSEAFSFCSDDDKRLATKLESLNEFSEADFTTLMSGFFVSDDGEVTAQGFGLEANVDLSSAKALLLYSAEIRRTKLEPETGVDVTAGFKKTGAALSEPFVDGLFAVSSGLGGAVGNDVSFGLARLNENLLTSCSEVGFGDRTGGLLSVLPSVNRNIRLCSGGGSLTLYIDYKPGLLQQFVRSCVGSNRARLPLLGQAILNKQGHPKIQEIFFFFYLTRFFQS